jgi:hypothetical protein
MNNEQMLTEEQSKSPVDMYWHSKSKSPVLKLLREEQRKDLTGMSK